MFPKLNKGHWLVFILTASYILGFALYYLSIRNYEFLWYIGVLLFFFALIFFTIHKSNFDYIILAGLSAWGLMHLAGGGVWVAGDVLYNLELIPLVDISGSAILKFDQFVHAFGFGVSTLVVFHLLYPYLNPKANWKIIFPLVVAAAAGLGALNEVVEFMAVIFFPETNVGGYTNTALDISFNFVGAILAAFLIKATNYKGYRSVDETFSAEKSEE
jgi:hypothetical protein